MLKKIWPDCLVSGIIVVALNLTSTLTHGPALTLSQKTKVVKLCLKLRKYAQIWKSIANCSKKPRKYYKVWLKLRKYAKSLFCAQYKFFWCAVRTFCVQYKLFGAQYVTLGCVCVKVSPSTACCCQKIRVRKVSRMIWMAPDKTCGKMAKKAMKKMS